MEPRFDDLHREIEELRRRLAEAEQTIQALSAGQIDAIVGEAHEVPLLLHESQEALQASEVRFRAVVDSAPAAIVVALAGKIVLWNQGAERLFLYSQQEAMDQPVTMLIPEPYLAQHQEAVQRFHASGGTHVPGKSYEAQALRKDGSQCPVQISLAVWQSAEGTFASAIITDITEQRRLEEARRSTEERFSMVFRASPTPIAIATASSVILAVNDRYVEFSGYPSEDLVGRSARDLGMWATPADRQRFVDAMSREGRVRDFETTFQRKSGENRHVLMSVESIELRDVAEPVRIFMFTDITGRKSAMENLRAAARYARSLIEASLDPLVTISPEGKITDVNAATEAVTGRRRADLIGSDFSGYFTEPERAREGYGKVLADNEVRDYPLTIRDVSGRRTDVLYNASVYRDEAGQVLGVFAAARDVSERKRAESVREAVYRISEDAQSAGSLHEFFERVHETVSTLIPARNFYVALLDPETGVLTFPYFVDEVDPQPAPKLPGRSLTEYVIRTGEPLLAAPDVFDDLVARGEVELIGTPSVDWLGVPLKTPGGTIGAVVVQTYSTGVRFGESDKDLLSFISGQLAMAIQRKRAEEALHESEAELKEAQRVAHVGSWSWVIETDTVTWSEELFRIAGRDPAGPAPNYSRDHATLYTPESLARLHLLVERAIRTGESYAADLELTRPDGTTRWIVDTGEARRDAKGQIVGLHGTVEDITEERRLQEQLLHSQKMEAVGRLAGGVAHDFNNLLTVILGYSDLLLGRFGPGDSARRELLEIRQAGKRATALTRQLLAFSRKQTLVPEILDMGDVIRSLSTMVQRLIGEDIDVRVVVPPGLGRVEADRGQIEQVVMNLAVNSRDAMPDGGSLVLELQNVDLDEAYASGHAEVEPGRYILMAVSDTGVGMDAEMQERIFEPFFTTKEQGKGTGLGLSTVYGIVHQSGGSIGVYSEPGQGTTFKIYLPRIDGAAEPPRRPSGSQPALATRSETILLVEDEPSIRELAKVVLETSGYTVLLAGDPAEAERIASDHQGPIHLVLTDVVMPGMNGRALAERLLGLRPDLRVLFMSGYTDDVIAHHGVLDAGTSFLQKPFTLHGLTQKVREVLDSRPSGSR